MASRYSLVRARGGPLRTPKSGNGRLTDRLVSLPTDFVPPAVSVPIIDFIADQSENVGIPFSFVPSFSGGQPPYTWTLFSGTLPDGLSLTPSTGEISGTPITAETQAGIVLEVSDLSMFTDQSNSFQMQISAAFDESFEFVGNWDETVASIPEPLFAVANHNEAFEFADSWDETVDGIPTPTFVSPNHNEAFEFADSWDETVVGTPSPTFASSNLDENYDSGWDGT